jgi:phosphohistidine phosphatase
MTTRRLWLLRHAKSSWDDPTLGDEDRPLAPRGHRAVAALARYLATEAIHPALVLCSSGLRARQTLAGVLPMLGGNLQVAIERELYTLDAGSVLARLQRVDDDIPSVMVVGHNPALQTLALTLASGGPARERAAEKLPTGALVTIELPDAPWARLAEGGGRLVEVVAPRDLEADDR